MKKNAICYCAGPAYYRMCSTDVYCSNKPAAAAPKETITHHFFVSELGRRKTVDAAIKFVAAQKIAIKKQKLSNIR